LLTADNGWFEMSDKILSALLEGLQRAVSQPGEQRLFKSGKLDGIFLGRAGVNGEAAARAIREGLLEGTRTETKGKTTIEWVRLTPAGVRFLHDHESPLKALEALRTTLQTTRDGVPAWLAEMRQKLHALEQTLSADAQRFLHHLEALSRRVEEGLQKLQAATPPAPAGLTKSVPWAGELLTYLESRATLGATGPCPLPELFAALAPRFAHLSLTDFHAGLRTLNDSKALRLLPFTEAGELTQPEYAMLEGDRVLYFATR
jgi:hypothetical protein